MDNPGVRALGAFWIVRPFDRSDRWIAALLALASFAVLIPNRGRFLNTTDSFLFALATEDYDFSRAHPHPPGYPVFVVLAKVLKPLFPDANAALVAVAMTFAALSISLLYLLVREFGSTGAGLVASLLFLSSPNLLYNGALALSYTAEGAMAIGITLAAVRVRDGRFPVSLLGVLFALALGLRQSSLFFLSPIVAWSILNRLPDFRRFAEEAAMFLAGAIPTFILWFVPMLTFGGGPWIWLEATQLQSRSVVFAYTIFNSGWPAVVDNVGRLQLFAQADIILLWVGLPLVVAAIALRGRVVVEPEERRRNGRAITVLLTWLLPGLLFYTFIFSGSHNGPRGYILVIEPVAFAAVGLLAGVCIRRASTILKSPTTKQVLGAAVFVGLLLLAIPFGQASAALLKKEVRDHDVWSTEWLRLKEEYSPEDTVVMASHSWAFAKWYFPEYRVWNFMPVTPDPAGTPLHFIMESRNHVDDVSLYDSWLHNAWNTSHPVPPDVKTVILLDFQLAGENNGIRALRPEVEVRETHLASGWRMLVFTPPQDHPTVESLVYLDDNSPQPR